MKILYYDCFTGISGDMNMAALIDVGADPDYLKSELKKLKIDDEFELEISKDIKNGITGTRVNVVLKKHHHAHDDDHSHHHSHRHYAHIRQMILKSGLSDFVKQRSIDTFDKIAVAEAKIHGTTVDKVHFHEVGATDSIVDVVGNAICIENLKPDLVISSTVQLGGGFVNCDHGTFPVPAPATTEILLNTPVKTGLVDSETTTPTGAAIVTTNASQFSDTVNFSILKTGYGLGFKTFEVPNVLRVLWAEGNDASPANQSYMCEVNLDDMNPEWFTYLSNKLFEMGASDVFTIPVGMKKNRPGIKLSVLCNENKLEQVNQFLLRETTTFGLRYFPVAKKELERKTEVIRVEGIPVRIKYALMDNVVVKHKPEYEDCEKLAGKLHISLKEAYQRIENALNNSND